VSQDQTNAKDLAAFDDGGKPLKDPRRERFCQETVATNSIAKAYELAGFSRARGNANRLMRETPIRARLEYLWKEAALTTAVMGGRILEQMNLIANANMFDFVDIDPRYGTTKVNLAKVQHVLGSLIQEISYDGKGRLKIKLHDKVAMLKFLAERADIEGKGADLEKQAANINVNMQLLQMVTKFDSMSEYDAVRRIVFAMRDGMERAKAQAMEPGDDTNAPPAPKKESET
jgi:hypothetical protein